jgi:acetylglutamate kinase
MRREPGLTVEILVEALPYIREFHGTTLVVKFGGNAMVDDELLQTFADDIVLLHSVGIQTVVVHGGGPQIGDVMERFGKEPRFQDGLRVTDAETLEIAGMVLVGKVTRQIVSAINVHGPLAVGLSGEDGGLIEAAVRDPALGYVGDVKRVNTQIIERLLAEELIPVVSTIGADLSAGQAYNINADTAAGAIAAELGVDSGVRSAHLLDGRTRHVLLLELFTDAGIGTMIVPAERAPL